MTNMVWQLTQPLCFQHKSTVRLSCSALTWQDKHDINEDDKEIGPVHYLSEDWYQYETQLVVHAYALRLQCYISQVCLHAK